MRFDEVHAFLENVAWGSAAGWSDDAYWLLREYYARLWMYDRRLGSAESLADEAIRVAVIDVRPVADRQRIRRTTCAILDAAEARGQCVEWTTEELIRLILGWAIAVDRRELHPSIDPGVPLVRLFGLGFQVKWNGENLLVRYRNGTFPRE